MTESFFTTATAIPALTLAFERVFDNHGGPGADGMSVSDFAVTRDTRIAALHWALTNRLYVPGPLRRVAIPKKSGGTRTLSIPCVTDRVAQTAVATALTSVLDGEFEEGSYAYRAGRSVKQAVARVAYLRNNGYPFVVDGDIRAYFDELPHDKLRARLAQSVDDADLDHLIGQWLAGFGDGGRGLAQGSPISPLLANLYLDDLDEMFGNGPVRIVRFADDFVLLTKSHKSAEAALARARDYLANHGLVLNLNKTRIVPFDGAFDFLGALFVRSVVIDSKDRATPAPVSAVLGPRSIAGPSTRPDVDNETEEEMARAVLIDPASASVADKETVISDADPLADFAGERSSADFALGLAPLYIFEKGRRLGAANECFTVAEGEAELIRVPAQRVGRIDIGRDVTVDDDAMRLAADHKIPLALVNGLGAAQAVLMPALADYAGLHMAQARLMLDPDRALAHAQGLVAGKLRNAHALLKRLNRRRKIVAVDGYCEAIQDSRRHAQHADSIDQARGFEGDGTKHYWQGLSLCLMHGFTLPRRRDDPANPVVAVLNFTASLLTRDVVAAVLRAGLHPGFGVLHVDADYRDACAFDLVEAFRAPLSEGLAVYLFNNRVLGVDDFQIVPDQEAVRLTGAASRKLVTTYEAWLARPVKNPRAGAFTTWRGLLLADARALADGLRSGDAFAPYVLDH